MKVWVQSGEKKVIFGTLCLSLGVYFISRFSLQQCASLETGQTCFQEFGRVKKNPTTCTVQGFHYCVRPECWQDFTHCFCVQCFHLQHVTSTMMWCLQICRTLWVSRRGNTCRPKTIQGFNTGLLFFSFFFPWQTVNSHLRFVTRCHRPDQSLTGFQRVARCVIRGCK